MTDSPAPPRRNPFGLASLIVGAVLLLASPLIGALLPALMMRSEAGWSAVGIAMNVQALIGAGIALIATALGVVGLLQRDRGRTTAIIGTTLGASYLVTTLVGASSSVLSGLLMAGM